MQKLSVAAEKILRESNTLLDGQHFVYISGDHGAGWVNKDVLIPDTKKVSELAQMLAVAAKELQVEIVCGPAIGGLVMSQWTAHHLGIPSVFTEHQDTPDRDSKEIRPPFILKRGFDRLVAGKKVLIVDDIVNTGHSIRETANAVRACNGTVVAAAAYCTRGNTDAAGMRVPQFIYLVEFKIPFWPAESCTLCKSDVPINTEFAHGREYVELKSRS